MKRKFRAGQHVIQKEERMPHKPTDHEEPRKRNGSIQRAPRAVSPYRARRSCRRPDRGARRTRIQRPRQTLGRHTNGSRARTTLATRLMQSTCGRGTCTNGVFALIASSMASI
jgi:hypothetical protein